MTAPIPNRWVLHDYLQVNGGAERLVISLANGVPGFELGVAGIYPGFLGSGDLMGLAPQILSGRFSIFPRIPRTWLTFSNLHIVEDAECVVYSGLYAPLAVSKQLRGRKVLYCHTPPRFAFDRESFYLDQVNPVFQWAVRMAVRRYRTAYQAALRQMDVVITNSHHVRKRLLALTGIDSTVVYPPTDIARFRWLGQGDYYLSLGRLEPNKRIDRVIRAFLKMPDKKLVVTSGGSQLETLKGLAAGAPNIYFTDWIDDKSLINWIGNAIACIYIPKDEDFGMSTVEAMSAGKPVIGVNEGGLKETIDHNRTGLLLPEDPSVECICDAIHVLDPSLAADMRTDCEARAAQFSLDRFLLRMSSLIDFEGNAK